MGKFSNYVIILRQIGPLYYYLEKGPANRKYQSNAYKLYHTFQLCHITFNYFSYHTMGGNGRNSNKSCPKNDYSHTNKYLFSEIQLILADFA